MPKTVAERMAAYRMRQRASGLATISLVVPQADAAFLKKLAKERRHADGLSSPTAPLRNDWFAVLDSSRKQRDGARTQSSTNDLTKRRADLLAEQILKRVILLGWPVGSPLGSETALMKEFAVSRPVLRQAIRLLEHHGVARVQRGAGGGLAISAPDATATAHAVSIYLEYQRIGPFDILETRRILEQATTDLATRRLTVQGESRLNDEIGAEISFDGHTTARSLQQFHFTVAELSGDPALRFFTGVVLHLSDAHSNFSRRSQSDRDKIVRRIKKLHSDIAKAMIARDAQTACRLMSRYLDGYKSWME